MQDPIESMSRTHHSNQDQFDRVPKDDLKQASVIMVACDYKAAMLNDRSQESRRNEFPAV